jgi:hypothetical protein
MNARHDMLPPLRNASNAAANLIGDDWGGKYAAV